MGLDLETLKKIKFMFSLFSDGSSHCLGYKRLTELIEQEENVNKKLEEFIYIVKYFYGEFDDTVMKVHKAYYSLDSANKEKDLLNFKRDELLLTAPNPEIDTEKYIKHINSNPKEKHFYDGFNAIVEKCSINK